VTLEGRSRQERQAALVSARAGIDVRKGSKADLVGVIAHVRYVPQADIDAYLALTRLGF